MVETQLCTFQNYNQITSVQSHIRQNSVSFVAHRTSPQPLLPSTDDNADNTRIKSQDQ